MSEWFIIMSIRTRYRTVSWARGIQSTRNGRLKSTHSFWRTLVHILTSTPKSCKFHLSFRNFLSKCYTHLSSLPYHLHSQLISPSLVCSSGRTQIMKILLQQPPATCSQTRRFCAVTLMQEALFHTNTNQQTTLHSVRYVSDRRRAQQILKWVVANIPRF
jgi:hypothetical protein